MACASDHKRAIRPTKESFSYLPMSSCREATEIKARGSGRGPAHIRTHCPLPSLVSTSWDYDAIMVLLCCA